jgi:hypothetical protein
MSRSGSKDSPHVYVLRPAHAWRAIVAVALAVGVALAVAACGGSSPKNSHRTKAADALLAFSECMRAQGVTNFPDPSTRGGIQLPQGMNPGSPSFRGARTACWHLLPGGGPNGHRLTKQQIAAMVATSECMRQHGVTDFPDPYAVSGNGPPNLNPKDYSSVEMGGGEVLAIPKSIDENSPVFTQAAKDCKFH